MKPSPPSENDTSSARDQVLDVAERHFAERGYAAVTLKDLAQELGMRQPSLYYHAPGGKEELFVAVMLRHLERHRTMIAAALAASAARGEDDMEPQLRRIASCMLSRPPLSLWRMVRSDMHKLSPESRATLDEAIQRCAKAPIRSVFERAARSGRLRQDPDVVTWFFISQIEALRARERYTERPAIEMLDMMLDLLLRGIIRD